MRCLNRNKIPIYYALYNGDTPYVDENGDRTGEFAISYLPPLLERMNVSPAQGTADFEPFGITEPYTHIMVTSNKDTMIEESSVLWIGRTPDMSIFANVPSGAAVWGQLEDGYMKWYQNVVVNNEVVTTPLGRTVPYNYVILRRADSLNSVSFAIRKVDVDGVQLL